MVLRHSLILSALTPLLGCGARTRLSPGDADAVPQATHAASTGSGPSYGEAPDPLLALGEYHTCAIKSGGEAYCWGAGFSGQLGEGKHGSHVTPAQVTGLTDALHIAGGGLQNCAVEKTGTLLSWGLVGSSDGPERLVPTAVPNLTGALQCAVGDSHGCAAMPDGTAWCWGQAFLGQRGVKANLDEVVPTAVPGMSDVVEVAAGGTHTCARRRDGSAACVGSNFYGELGRGTVSGIEWSAAPVHGLTAAVQIAAGEQHTCARLRTGEVKCWGRGGMLGVGTTVDQPTPTKVTGLPDALAIAVGGYHTCALDAEGGVWCWGGGNASGQLGNGTTSGGAIPARVPGLTAAAIAAGYMHTCARTPNAIVCWGKNASGQLGDGTTIDRLTPTPVVPF